MGFAWLSLLVVLGWFRWARALQDEDVFTSPGGYIRDFALAKHWVYVVTCDHLYQLNLSLGLVNSLHQRGEYVNALDKGSTHRGKSSGRFNRVMEGDTWSANFSVNTLAPVGDMYLFTCGGLVSGFCEILDLENITRILWWEDYDLSPAVPKGASVGFEVNVKANSYILAAVEPKETNDQNDGDTPKKSRIRLHNTNDSQFGNMFSDVGFTDAPEILARLPDVQFMDGFQINSTIFVFSNVKGNLSRVRLLWFDTNTGKLSVKKTGKSETLKSLRGATLVSDEAQQRLVSSSVISGDHPVLWVGIFTNHGSINTELAVFDISPPTDAQSNTDPDFTYKEGSGEGKEPTMLRPRRVLLKHPSMTSVLAVKLNNWLIVFIGTGDGQLLKLTVDADLQPDCVRVIWKAPDDRLVFPKMHLDPVSRKHVFMALRNQLMRVPVAQCGNHNSLESCWNARDPHCGWCPSLSRCSFEDECPSSLWLTLPEDLSQRRMTSHGFKEGADGQIQLVVFTHLKKGGSGASAAFSCRFHSSTGELPGLQHQYPQCTCLLPPFIADLRVNVTVSLGETDLTAELNLHNCSGFTGASPALLCSRCLAAGCVWSNAACTWTHSGAEKMSVCSALPRVDPLPEIFNITPAELSFHGRNHALLSGRNLDQVVGVRLQGDLSCSPKEVSVLLNTGTSVTFHIPPGDKGRVKVCLVLPGGSCHGTALLTYLSAPVCTAIAPENTWASGKRKMNITVSNLDFVEEVIHSSIGQKVSFSKTEDGAFLQYESPAAGVAVHSTVSLRVANHTMDCPTTIHYLPDPEFTTFTYTHDGERLVLTIEKKADGLNMAFGDLQVWGFLGSSDQQQECDVRKITEQEGVTKLIVCIVQGSPQDTISRVKIMYGDVIKYLVPSKPLTWLLFLLLIPLGVIVGGLVVFYQRRRLTAQMEKRLEDQEMDIRNDIRQGFVDMQMENSNLMENVGATPFLDYQQFASRIFFPEGGSLMMACLGHVDQDLRKKRPDEACTAMAELLREPLFLTSMVHALEEQKTFTIQHRCTVASVLTVALHQDLGYLTEVMEQLLQAAMEQPSGDQHKLLLRRTQSVVEKLLTNWMSICLYGFLRENVGQQLHLLVSALTQQIAKGPVDSVTEKAMYTLSEDWLLWQAQDFTPVTLQVVFAVGGDGQLSEPLEVAALSCDTVDQVKHKILAVFKAKFDFAYNIPLRDIRLELERGPGECVALEEVDHSSEVVGEVTMLNTLMHYKVPDKATVKVLSTGCHPPMASQSSVKDDQDFSLKYFHLIDPDQHEEQSMNPERKKLKLKEVHLTKLLSTKTAVHSYVVELFRGIWGVSPGKAPPAAIKHFFDFLDAQAARMKITDPDVLHIWKTNSLPLRFWVNILKNPQFVFDMEKSGHQDGCLSVIAQAFMDSFSLSETQLGKHAPTNKLLYAKDVPQFKKEVKAYYKWIRDQQPITAAEFKDFLLEESRKHFNEFNEDTAIRELYKFIRQYYTEIEHKLAHNDAPAWLRERLQCVRSLFDGQKTCSWD